MGFLGPLARGGTTVQLMVYVRDVDATVDRAVAAGGKLKRPVENQFYGDRSGTLEDPFGHVWTIATHVEDVPPAEMRRRSERGDEENGERRLSAYFAGGAAAPRRMSSKSALLAAPVEDEPLGVVLGQAAAGAVAAVALRGGTFRSGSLALRLVRGGAAVGSAAKHGADQCEPEVHFLRLPQVVGTASVAKMSPMPIYEFTCRTCSHEFETLLRSTEIPSCVRCASVELDKKLSVFATPTQPDAPAACGTCGDPRGPGACRFN